MCHLTAQKERAGGAQTLRWLQESVNLDPAHAAFSSTDTTQMRQAFKAYDDLEPNASGEGKENIVKYATYRAQQQQQHLTSSTGQDKTGEDDCWSNFKKRFADGYVGMGPSGRDFLRRYQKYVASDQANFSALQDTEAVRVFLSSGKWKYYETVQSQQPQMLQELLEYLVQLSDAEQDKRSSVGGHGTTASGPSATSFHQEEDDGEARKMQLFQERYRSVFQGEGTTGGNQLSRLRTKIKKDPSSSLYDSTDTFRSMLTRNRNSSFWQLEMRKPDLAASYLEFGV
ncbi:uncharacterized protein I303_102594 [Kwoniella dejecticola CBS 10117]|uniref:Uncharacterized protein n=1 Tax=Kwoniella dejecticola CBS 10117 TaxID=1296121 RepID=A0A1A6A967_9TREE|nr:uncharacterized protein I303_02608 [Kwoniella dejecticola CBS 10117]OBR86599.1 hypothetical protein I303_02608 [Kwoniella dejecticola CBS 10117]